MAAHRRVRLPPIPDSASFLLISRSARFYEFHEPLRMRRRRSEDSNANGVARKSPSLGERNDPDFHGLLRLRVAISGNAAKQMPLSTIRHMASNPPRRMRTFNRRLVRAAAALAALIPPASSLEASCRNISFSIDRDVAVPARRGRQIPRSIRGYRSQPT